MSDVNSAAFTPEEVKKGLHLDLIKYLLDYNSKSEKSYNDIHITTDGYCLIVEWTNLNYEYSSGCGFRYVDEEHELLKEVVFPDNHTEYLFDDEEQEALDDWLKENPGWFKNDYGRWVNKTEQEEMEKFLTNLGATDTTNVEDKE